MKTVDEIKALPFDERLDHYCALLDGTVTTPHTNAPLMTLVSLLQLSLVPTKGLGAADAKRSYNGAKSWLEGNGLGEQAEQIMNHVAKETPWLVGALATEPAPKGDAKFLATNGNSYNNAGKPGEFAANYRQEAHVINSVREEFIALARENPADIEASTGQLKKMQDRVLGQVMTSSALIDCPAPRYEALAGTIEKERARLERDNPGLLAQHNAFDKTYQHKASMRETAPAQHTSSRPVPTEEPRPVPKQGFLSQIYGKIVRALREVSQVFTAIFADRNVVPENGREETITRSETVSLDQMRGNAVEPVQTILPENNRRQNQELRAAIGRNLSNEERLEVLGEVSQKAPEIAGKSAMQRALGDNETAVSHNLPAQEKGTSTMQRNQ